MAEEPFPPDAIPFAIPAGALRLTSWPVAQPLDRIHAAVFGAAQFNPGVGQVRCLTLMALPCRRSMQERVLPLR